VIKKLHPTQKGSLRWQSRYGAALVCVRYRDDARHATRYTTVELVVDIRRIAPHPGTLVLVPINAFDETKRQQAVELGAKWKRRDKAWLMTLDAAKRLGLLDRIDQNAYR
jgi:hypothetical protein